LPNLIDATTEYWVPTLMTLTRMYPTATFVSGHGDVGTVEDVKAFQGYLVDLRKFVSDARSAGKTGDALVDDVLPRLKEKYGDWSAFNNFAKRDISQTGEEFAGTKKIPIPAPK
jgi:hypothetical protein